MSLAWLGWGGCRIWRDSRAPDKSHRDSNFNCRSLHRNFYSTWRERKASFDYVWHVTFEHERVRAFMLIILSRGARLSILYSGRSPPTHPPTSVWSRVLMPKAATADFAQAFERELEKCFEWRAEAALSLRIEYLLNLCGRGQYPLVASHEVRAASSPYVPLEMRIRSSARTKVTSIVARRLHSSEWAGGAFHKFAHSFHKRVSALSPRFILSRPCFVKFNDPWRYFFSIFSLAADFSYAQKRQN